MNICFKIGFFSALFICHYSILSAQGISATEIVRKADEKFNGEKSSMMVMSMTIVRPAWQRTVEFKNWSMGQRLCSYTDFCTCKRCRSDIPEKRQ